MNSDPPSSSADAGPPKAGCLTWLLPQLPVVVLTIFAGLILLVGIAVAVAGAGATAPANVTGHAFLTDAFFLLLTAIVVLPAAALGLGVRLIALLVSSTVVGFVMASLLEWTWLGFKRLRLDDKRWIKKGAAWGALVGFLLGSGELMHAFGAPTEEALEAVGAAWDELAMFGCIGVWLGGAAGAVVLAMGRRDNRRGVSTDRSPLERIPRIVRRWMMVGVLLSLLLSCWVSVLVPLLSQLGEHRTGPPSVGAALGLLLCTLVPLALAFGAAGSVHHAVQKRRAAPVRDSGGD